jgi:hypothetical protein
MSSATSTDAVRLKPDTSDRGGPGGRLEAAPADGLQPWQFFVLAALICATVVTYLVRGQGVTVVLLLSVLMATTALVGLAALRTVRPLFMGFQDRTPMVGERTRAALEREKVLALRTLKELEFDRAMKKISDDDHREISTRLRARAARIIHQLDAGAGYRAKIEADLARRLSTKDTSDTKAQAATCGACKTQNDADAKFCKGCGQKL